MLSPRVDGFIHQTKSTHL